jgi:hypothetical protein
MTSSGLFGIFLLIDINSYPVISCPVVFIRLLFCCIIVEVSDSFHIGIVVIIGMHQEDPRKTPGNNIKPLRNILITYSIGTGTK